MTTAKTDVMGRPMEYVYRHKSHLAGVSHPNKRGKNRVRLVSRLRVGTQLVLKPEPDNRADRDAILVYQLDEPLDDLGYLYSFTARSVARKMRCGATFSAEISAIVEDLKYPVVSLYVYQLTKMTAEEPQRSEGQYYRRAQYVGHELLQPAHYAPAPEHREASSQTNREVRHMEPPETAAPEERQQGWLRRLIAKLR